MTEPRFWLVVPAAGIGQRMQADCPKQYLRIRDRFLLDITLSRLLEYPAFTGCIVALNQQDQWWPQTDACRAANVMTCEGGDERADSVLAALQALAGQAGENDWVLVHDVARPCISQADLDKLTTALSGHPVGGLLAAPVTDTLKEVRPGDHGLEVTGTPDRRRLWRALTPQMFRYDTLVKALEQAKQNGRTVTDEASAIEMLGSKPLIVEGRPDNIKVTLPADLALAEFILGQLDVGERHQAGDQE